MKKFLVFASAILASTALSAQNPAVKSTTKPVNSSTSPSVKPAAPVKSQPVQKETVKPLSQTEIQNTPSKNLEPKKQSPAKQGKPNHKKRTKKEVNKNLGTVKKGAYQTAPEMKQSK